MRQNSVNDVKIDGKKSVDDSTFMSLSALLKHVDVHVMKTSSFAV